MPRWMGEVAPVPGLSKPDPSGGDFGEEATEEEAGVGWGEFDCLSAERSVEVAGRGIWYGRSAILFLS